MIFRQEKTEKERKDTDYYDNSGSRQKQDV